MNQEKLEIFAEILRIMLDTQELRKKKAAEAAENKEKRNQEINAVLSSSDIEHTKAAL